MDHPQTGPLNLESPMMSWKCEVCFRVHAVHIGCHAEKDFGSPQQTHLRNLSSSSLVISWGVISDGDSTLDGFHPVSTSCGRKHSHASLNHRRLQAARELVCGQGMFPLKVHELGVALRLFRQSAVAWCTKCDIVDFFFSFFFTWDIGLTKEIQLTVAHQLWFSNGLGFFLIWSCSMENSQTDSLCRSLLLLLLSSKIHLPCHSLFSYTT